MQQRLLSLFIAVTAAFYAPHALATTYPDLAKASMQKTWNQFKKEADVLNKPGFLPHETKDLRKRIGTLRESLDLFVYSYWNTKKQDPWMQIRDFLDEGYELIGAYKDLYDIQNLESPESAVYDNDEVQALRRDIQVWWQRWGYSYSDVYIYLMNPSQTKIYPRDKNELSRFYWGASELTPDLQISGEANLSRLSQDLLITALNDWPTVKKIKNPISSMEKENQFHDLRKRFRSVARILRSFEEIYTGSEENLVRLEELSDRYGSINDKITAAHRAEKNGKKKKLEKLEEEIKDDWKSLVEFQEQEDLPRLLNETLKSLTGN